MILRAFQNLEKLFTTGIKGQKSLRNVALVKVKSTYLRTTCLRNNLPQTKLPHNSNSRQHFELSNTLY